MKKTIKIALFFIFCIILSTTCVKAEGDEYRVTLSPDKKTLQPGDEVTITILMENTAISNGIYSFVSNIEFSEDIFDIVTEEDLGDEEIKMLYDGTNDPELIDSGNPWGVIMMNDGENKLLYAQSIEETPVGQGTSQVVGRIKLKVKSNAMPTTGKLNLLSKTAFDNLEVLEDPTNLDSDAGYTIEDSEQDAVQLQIVSSTGSGSTGSSGNTGNTGSTGNTGTTGNTGSQTSKDDYQTIGNKQNNTQKQNKVQTENKATGSAPYTGIEDYIPFIFIGIIISVMAYINYQKYKNI
jgi:hypothetical protein